VRKPTFSPALFTATFCCVYIAAFFFDWPMFRYYPLHGDFSWGPGMLTEVGPAMSWYGYLSMAVAGGLIIAMIVPDRVLPRWLGFLWLFPLSAMLICVLLLRRFFL
jgi:hypothetical protein